MLARDIGSPEVLQLLKLPHVGRASHTRTFGFGTIVLVDELMAALVPDFAQLSAHVDD
jgi:hypothetical protein